MITFFPLIKKIHLITVAITTVLFILRFIWLQAGSTLSTRRWVRTVPHLNDTLLLLSGVGMMLLAHIDPLTARVTG